MSRLSRDGTAEPVSRDQILRHARGQGNINFPCSVDHEQDWQPYPVDPYSAICDDHTHIHTYTLPVYWCAVLVLPMMVSIINNYNRALIMGFSAYFTLYTLPGKRYLMLFDII